MPRISAAVLGSLGYSKGIGKEEGVTDVAHYGLRKGDDSVSLLEPIRYPERLSSLLYSLAGVQLAILVVEELDASLGETVLMLDCMGIDRGWIVLRNYIQEEQLRPLLAGTCVDGYELREDDPNALREELISLAAAVEENESPHGSLAVDQHFNVRGVGTVVLGPVMDGVIRRHDHVTAHPLGTDVVVRSVRKHDKDFDSTVIGERAGLGLRGVEAEQLDRGYVLSNDPSIVHTSEFEGDAELVRYWPSALKEGMVLHLGHWLQSVPFRLLEASGEDWRRPRLRLQSEGEIIHPPGSVAILTYLEGGKLRVVGRIRLPQ